MDAAILGRFEGATDCTMLGLCDGTVVGVAIGSMLGSVEGNKDCTFDGEVLC